jgi:hypothetical protein
MCGGYPQLKQSENLWKIFWLVDRVQGRKDVTSFKLQYDICPSRIAPPAIKEPPKRLCTGWRLVPASAKDRRLCGCLLAAAIVVLAGPVHAQPKSESPSAPVEKTATAQHFDGRSLQDDLPAFTNAAVDFTSNRRQLLPHRFGASVQ